MTTRTPIDQMSIPELRREYQDLVWSMVVWSRELWERQMALLRELRNRGQVAPDKKPFTWGTVTQWHKIGDITIAESIPDEPCWSQGEKVPPKKRQGPAFHAYVGSDDTGHSRYSLDAMLIFALAWKYDPAGANTQADGYFMKMIEMKD